MKSGLNKGQLIKWNDDRGFGFIKPCEGGKDVFLHISALKTTGRHPQVGDTIFYELTTGPDGRIRAAGASIQGVISQTSTTQKRRTDPAQKKPKKHRFIEGIIIFASMVTIASFLRQCGPGHSPPLNTVITKPDCVIKGNISVTTGSKLYHMPGMEDYEGTIIDPGKGEKWFCSESEAQTAGWSKAPR
jgi:cold shock CspA family protein